MYSSSFSLNPTRGSSFFLGKVIALGVLCCFALFVCLTLLASFFLPSSSPINIYSTCDVLYANVIEVLSFHSCRGYLAMEEEGAVIPRWEG